MESTLVAQRYDMPLSLHEVLGSSPGVMQTFYKWDILAYTVLYCNVLTYTCMYLYILVCICINMYVLQYTYTYGYIPVLSKYILVCTSIYNYIPAFAIIFRVGIITCRFLRHCGIWKIF